MTNKDRQFIGIMCGSPFGIVGMIVTGTVAFIFNKDTGFHDFFVVFSDPRQFQFSCLLHTYFSSTAFSASASSCLCAFRDSRCESIA